MLPAQPLGRECRAIEPKPHLQIGYQMFWQSIRRNIVGIALGLIILMVLTSVLSIIMANRVEYLLNTLTTKYVAAYGHLARTNIRSLERGLALRQMVIAKMQNPPDEAGYAARLNECVPARTGRTKWPFRPAEQSASGCRRVWP